MRVQPSNLSRLKHLWYGVLETFNRTDASRSAIISTQTMDHPHVDGGSSVADAGAGAGAIGRCKEFCEKRIIRVIVT